MPEERPTPQGVPIDEVGPPAWVLDYFSPAQVRDLTRPLLWTLLIYKSRGLGAPAVSLAQRIYIAVHTMRKTETKRAWQSVRTLSVELDMASTNTVMSGLKALERDGWITTRRRPNNGKEYLPCWPVEDCIAPSEGPERCGAPTAKGICTRRAGWGTDADRGPCKLHREEDGPADAEDGSVSHEMRHGDPPEPVDNPAPDPPEPASSVSPDATPGVSPHEAASQEMRHGVAGGETEYIKVGSEEFDQRRVTPLRPAQPELEDSPAGRAEPPAKRDHLRVIPSHDACQDCGTVLDPDRTCFTCPPLTGLRTGVLRG